MHRQSGKDAPATERVVVSADTRGTSRDAPVASVVEERVRRESLHVAFILKLVTLVASITGMWLKLMDVNVTSENRSEQSDALMWRGIELRLRVTVIFDN